MPLVLICMIAYIIIEKVDREGLSIFFFFFYLLYTNWVQDKQEAVVLHAIDSRSMELLAKGCCG